MSQRNVIVDYGVGNILSVYRAFEYCGADIHLVDDPKLVRDADRVVLPGVGAFASCVDALKERNLFDAVATFIGSGRPMLGICVGMQLLFGGSHEFGFHKGLGVISGEVKGLPAVGANGERLKVPHVGWAPLNLPEGASMEKWSGTILSDVEPGSYAYFVHSFGCVPEDPARRVADTEYGGHTISAVVSIENVVACQFHPEKSGPVGLRMIKNFLNK